MDMLGPRLRQTRRALDLTQQQLEQLSGVHYTTISRIEKGHTTQVYAETVRQLAKVLHVSTDYLLGLTDEPGPPPPSAHQQPRQAAPVG